MRDFRFNNFDAIRLFAALQVVIVHSVAHMDVDPTGTVVKWLRLFPGVAIFFVISGFLISASFERSKSLADYFSNRALRIFPALWVCLLVSVGMAWSVERFSLTSTDFFVWMGTQATFFQFYHPEFLRQFGIGVLNGSLWTIPVELQFYALLPALIVLLRFFDWRWTFWIFLLAMLVVLNRLQVNLADELGLVGKLLKVTIIPHLYLFFAGVLLQRYFMSVVELVCKYLWLTLVIYLLVAYYCALKGIGYAGEDINPVSAMILAVLVIGVGYAKVPEKPLLKGFDISYGVYIYHMPFVNFLLEVQGFSPYLRFFCVMVLTILAATASWIFIEKPALSLKSSFSKKRRLEKRQLASAEINNE